MGMFVYVLILDAVMIFTNPAEWQESVSKLGVDAGSMLLTSQTAISRSIDILNTETDINPHYRSYLNNQIMGGIAFTLMLILISLGILSKFVRSETTSFKSWVWIVLISIGIIGFLQVLAGVFITGEVMYPYHGFVELFCNMHIVTGSFFKSVPLSNLTMV